ncbi:MAG: GNAT family N-acetyltransferase [Methanoregulaceae archaeon]|nr:GNAT family N-acetyltransferase [Methanoregulaceae archaeon]
MECRLVDHGTPEYEATVSLRYEVLRKPLGLDFTPEQLAAEVTDLHCALWEFGIPEPLACLVLTPLSEGEIKMRQVAVRPDHQGQGLGRILVEFSETTARARGFTRMVLNARDTAVDFYLRLGYTIEGEPFTEVTIPHRRMAKSL